VSVPGSEEIAAVQSILETIGVRSLSPPVAVTGGWSGTAIWRVETEDGPRSLRVYEPWGQYVVPREVEILEHARSAGLPVAKVLASGIDGAAPFMLLDWMSGRGMDYELLKRPWRAIALGEQAGRLQARLNQVRAPRELPHALSWADPDAIPQALQERLRAPEVWSDHLLHLDFHPGNLIVENGRIGALIDWTNACAGDPRFDVARTWVILRLLPGINGARRVAVRHIVGALLLGWRRAYLREIGPLGDMPPFLAWAGYATLADMRRKPEATAETEAGRQLRAQLDGLERKVEAWMVLSGLPGARRG
jgi:aminoglycoside phosphotransferase (APT) family kinase protein